MNKNYLLKIFNLSRFQKTCVQILTDVILIAFSLFLSLLIRLDDIQVIINKDHWFILIFLIPITILINSRLGFYQSIIRYVSDKFFITAGFAICLSAISMFLGSEIFQIFIPRSIPFIYFNFLFILTISIRYFLKSMFLNYNFDQRKPMAIYGAGDAGIRLLNSLHNSLEFQPLMFLDDDNKLTNKTINGIKVNQFDKSIHLLKKLNIKLILLALPSVSITSRAIIINRLEKYNIEVKTIPSMTDLINGRAEITDFFNITIKDILERDEIPSKTNLMKSNIFQKIVLVTGGGGSIGSELCNQILKIKPKIIIYLDNSEYALYKVNNEIQSYISINNLNIKAFPILGSVQDKKFLKNLFNKYKIQTIYHTAAYKHVPLVEQNIIEGLKNNIFGTKIIAELAIINKVETFMLISSDKAVRPTNYMGASKRLAELICQNFSENQNDTVFCIVRFGNVIGSSGSVIPLFEKQIKNNGPVTVTHKEVTRFFMTIKEAVGLVIQAGAMSKNGDLFILDMGKPIKILHLAEKMIRLYGKIPLINYSYQSNPTSKNVIEIKLTGLRPGEKIYEELLIDNNSLPTKHPRILRARERSIDRQRLTILLDNLNQFSKNEDLKNIKLLLEKAEIGFNTSKRISDLV